MLFKPNGHTFRIALLATHGTYIFIHVHHNECPGVLLIDGINELKGRDGDDGTKRGPVPIAFGHSKWVPL
jgi:hypothetical protein